MSTVRTLLRRINNFTLLTLNPQLGYHPDQGPFPQSMLTPDLPRRRD